MSGTPKRDTLAALLHEIRMWAVYTLAGVAAAYIGNWAHHQINAKIRADEKSAAAQVRIADVLDGSNLKKLSWPSPIAKVPDAMSLKEWRMLDKTFRDWIRTINVRRNGACQYQSDITGGPILLPDEACR
jgi:hypothetical protein